MLLSASRPRCACRRAAHAGSRALAGHGSGPGWAAGGSSRGGAAVGWVSVWGSMAPTMEGR